jgi:hypothetical protein
MHLEYLILPAIYPGLFLLYAYIKRKRQRYEFYSLAPNPTILADIRVRINDFENGIEEEIVSFYYDNQKNALIWQPKGSYFALMLDNAADTNKYRQIYAYPVKAHSETDDTITIYCYSHRKNLHTFEFLKPSDSLKHILLGANLPKGSIGLHPLWNHRIICFD